MKNKKILKTFLITAAAVSVVFTVAFFAPKVIPNNTYIGSVPVSGLSIEQARDAIKQKQKENQVTIRLGDKKVAVSYEALGIAINAEKTIASIKTNSNFSMASILPSSSKKKLTPLVTVDEKTLKHAILAFFPVLSDSEETASQFFLTEKPAKQKKNFTFHFNKLVSQLTYDAESLRGSDIEIEVLPYDDIEGPIKTQEELTEEKKTLSEKTLILRAEGDDIAKLKWEIDLSQPEWITNTDSEVLLNEDLLREYFEENITERMKKPVQDVEIKNFSDEGKAATAEIEGIGKDGISVPIEENIKLIQQSVSRGDFEVSILIDRIPAFVYNQTKIDLGDMVLLATGRSNFAGSPAGRVFNIQKGLREKFNNIIIPPGAEFSFNNFLGSVTNKAGWKNALGIFGGVLRMTPGAGLCQVSTTVYRAAINAGLPIVERRSHSLYVTYYKEYGEGLDATIFQGGQDLIFKNDMPSYILMQSYDDGDDAYVKIYGTSDGRSVALEGPYRTDNIPADKKEKYNYMPRRNEIVWYGTVSKSDGTKIEEQIVSRYKSLPK